MTEKEAWAFIKDELKYLRTTMDDHIKDEVAYQRFIQQQLSDIKLEFTKEDIEKTVKINAFTYLLTTAVSATVALLVLWLARSL